MPGPLGPGRELLPINGGDLYVERSRPHQARPAELTGLRGRVILENRDQEQLIGLVEKSGQFLRHAFRHLVGRLPRLQGPDECLDRLPRLLWYLVLELLAEDV